MNIILLISDTFRYDNLFKRASMPVNTPNLDIFAEKAVNMENAYASSFPTIPHRTDVTTARTGWPWYPWQPLHTTSRNHTPKSLREQGFVSQLLCDCPHLFKAGFQSGFDAAYHERGQEGDTYFLRMNRPIREVVPLDKTRPGGPMGAGSLADAHKWTNCHWREEIEEDRFAPRTAATTVQWLEENHQYDPFFLWVDFFDPHEPWDPPEYLVRKYDPDYSGTPMIHPNYGRADDYTEAELRNLRAHYCAEAEMVDRAMGRILEKIEDLNLWENSVVIFTSDHGMSLGEHNRTGKTNINPGDDRSWPIYPEVAHVPAMIAAPGVQGGRYFDNLFLPEDIMPTALDLAGVTVESQDPFHGISFAPVFREGSAQPEQTRDVVVSGKCLRNEEGELSSNATVPVVYTTEWAYVPLLPDGHPELYHLPTDPLAEKNIIGENPQTACDLHQQLIAYLENLHAPEDTIRFFSE